MLVTPQRPLVPPLIIVSALDLCTVLVLCLFGGFYALFDSFPHRTTVVYIYQFNTECHQCHDIKHPNMSNFHLSSFLGEVEEFGGRPTFSDRICLADGTVLLGLAHCSECWST